MSDIFKVIELKTAKDVLDYLRPSAKHWGTYARWIFRGQVNADWKLLPKVWRENKLQINIPANYGGQYLFGETQVLNKINQLSEQQKQNLYRLSAYSQFEIEYIQDFINTCNLLGLHAPNFQDLQNIIVEDFQQDYIKNLLVSDNKYLWTNGAIGLAQHHGIPTRLLDWTYSPSVAGYFSSCGQDSEIKNCAIYAIDITALYIDRFSYPPQTEGFIHLTHVQTTENNFLFRQQALFTYDDSGDKYYLENGKYSAMEDTLARIADNYKFRNAWRDSFRKIIFPATEKQELQTLLKKEGYYKASLMATYDNIAEEINQRKYEAESRSK